MTGERAGTRCPRDRRALRGLTAGTHASIVAAVVIAVLLALIYRGGVEALFEPPGLYGALALLALGVVAGAAYASSAPTASPRMRTLGPLVLALAGAGVALGAAGHARPGAALIILAYVAESGLGIPLSRDLAALTPWGSRLFISGVSLFTATLPLVLLDARAALAPLAGDLVKTAGLLIVARELGRCRRGGG